MKRLQNMGFLREAWLCLCLFVLLLSACAVQQTVSGSAYRVTLTVEAGNDLYGVLAGMPVSHLDWKSNGQVVTFRLPDAKAVEMFRDKLLENGFAVQGLTIMQTD